MHSVTQTNSPIDRDCPTCQAKAGDRCTHPTDNGRREVKAYCLGRIFVMDDAPQGSK